MTIDRPMMSSTDVSARECEVREASRARLDRLYEIHAPRVYRIALLCTANEAEAERVTEAVFVTVLRDLASWADGGPSALLAIFGAARQELNDVGSPLAELTTGRADSSRVPRVASR